MPLWLFAILFVAFVLYTDDYVIAGVLPEIALELAVTEAQAGQLVTLFSLTVAVVAPVASVVLARVSRIRLFTSALMVFVCANVAAALVPSFGWLMVLRVVAACAAAASTPALFGVAVERAPSGHVGRYVAVVALGVTGSIAAGVPLGTWISGLFGWRATFLAMAIGGAAALVFLVLTFGASTRPTEVPRLGDQLRILAMPAVFLGLLANTVLMTGSMMMLTYLAPYLADTAGAAIDERALTFALAGVAGMLGIWGGGIATDRWGPDRTLLVGVGTFVAAMASLWLLWEVRPAPLAAVMGVLAVWGAAAFWNSPAIQARLGMIAGTVAPQALALNTSGTYLGVSLGAGLGGLILGGFGSGVLPPVAAVCGVASLALVTLAARSARRVLAPAAE